ncbi:hypothetical protein [Leptolyngbya sp. FACHB-261]|nr:hypothetical protein [Leptolyngbya sp. FACHB-261]
MQRQTIPTGTPWQSLAGPSLGARLGPTPEMLVENEVNAYIAEEV